MNPDYRLELEKFVSTKNWAPSVYKVSPKTDTSPTSTFTAEVFIDDFFRISTSGPLETQASQNPANEAHTRIKRTAYYRIS